jgi:DNA repair photolyase
MLRETQARSILNKSGISGIDYTINPYVGCRHACLYCYADFMGRFTGHREPWGTFVDAKINAPEVLARQLRRASPGCVSLSTVTDPYQPMEARYRLTRRLLEQFTGTDFQVSVLTKSSLVVRDLDVLRRISRVEVGFSLTTLDPAIAQRFEPGASSPTERLEAMRDLSEAGIDTWLFIAPALPYFTDTEPALDALFAAAKRAGARSVLVDSFQFYPKPWGRVRALLESKFAKLVPLYEEVRRNPAPFRLSLRERVETLASRHAFPARCAF